ncbi:hypothetical protein GGF50DRAFT_110295 [Schizophyllum commune]
MDANSSPPPSPPTPGAFCGMAHEAAGSVVSDKGNRYRCVMPLGALVVAATNVTVFLVLASEDNDDEDKLDEEEDNGQGAKMAEKCLSPEFKATTHQKSHRRNEGEQTKKTLPTYPGD